MGLPIGAAVLAACSPSPQDAAMRSSSRSNDVAAPASIEPVAAAPDVAARDFGNRPSAAMGPVPEAVSAAANPAPSAPVDTPAIALGRRTLSTAFVRVGPDGDLTIRLRNGRVLTLRNVVMRPKDYCGRLTQAGSPAARYCGGYADVAAAWPGTAALD